MIFKKRKKSFINNIVSFRVFVLGSILIIVFLGVNLGKEYYREYQIQKEINSLKKDIKSFEKNNYKLSQLTKYYKTDEYKEAEIRKRLNMKKEGEKVVIIDSNSGNKENVVSEMDLNKDMSLPNYIKWWNYFFASKEK